MPGISVSKICVPFGGGGINWSSYWSTLISATVENAAPTHVVLTFPTAQTSLGAADFTIAGFTVNSVSWTGAVLTLVLSTAVLVFHEDLIITFVKTGDTVTVTNNVVDDGNTVAWYTTSDLTTITKDGSNLISKWADKLNSGHDLLQATPSRQPTLVGDEINFNADFIQTEDFTLNQPITIYAVVKPNLWGAFRQLIDGKDAAVTTLGQTGVTPQVKIAAGKNLGNADLPIGEYSIVRIVFNGANSKLQIDDADPITGNAGNNAMGGITLGAQGDGLSQFAYYNIKEAIFRNVADAAPTEALIFNYIGLKHGLVVVGFFTMLFPFVLG